jgi:hypothetical protein
MVKGSRICINWQTKMECIIFNSIYRINFLKYLRAAILCSKYIDPNAFLETMIKNNKNFESFSFNENYKIHEG